MTLTWISPCQPENFEYVIECFDKYGKINWFQNRKYNIGDVVYLYESSPTKSIRFKSIVTDVNFYLKEDDEINKSIIQTELFDDGPFAEFTPLFEFEMDGQLSFDKLKQYGLKSRLMGSQKISDELIRYIITVEQIQRDPQEYEKYIQQLSIGELKLIAKKYSTKKVKQNTTTVFQYSRSEFIAQYAKRRANGFCQLCGKEAPFKDKNGQPYLESHHIKWLSQGGSDTIENTIALCPNCHKKMHIVADKNDIRLLKKKAKE